MSEKEKSRNPNEWDVSDAAAGIIDPLLFMGSGAIEQADMPESRRMMRNDVKAVGQRIIKSAAAGTALGGALPDPGSTWHFISAAKYDYWNVIIEAVKLAGGAEEFYASTWTMNRNNVLELLTLYDQGLIKKFSILTGTYFKARETSVYAQLLNGIMTRGQRYVAFINHTKIALIRNEKYRICMEGSANFTANPRLENFIICNDQALYDFHREWMEEMLCRPVKKK
jgi:hypothetical protein